MIQSVINTIKSYFRALSIIQKLNLWKYFFIPIIISVTTATVIGLLVYFLSDDLGYYISKLWKWDFGKETFGIIGNILSGITIITIGFMLYKYIVLALSAPFVGPVSEKIEKYLYGNQHQHKDNSFSELLVRGIRLNIRNLTRELLLTTPVLILGLIPGIGVISSVLLFLMQSYYAGFGNMDFILERHFDYKQSIAFVKKNKGVAIGNGIVFMTFLLIPVIGIILALPFSVTAATIETVKKIQ